MVDLDSILGIGHKLAEMGFVNENAGKKREQPHWDDEMVKAGWTETDYILASKDQLPQRKLTINEHPRYGVNIAVNSFPFDEKYYFGTSSPVTPHQALRLLKRYLEATSQGRKYNGK